MKYLQVSFLVEHSIYLKHFRGYKPVSYNEKTERIRHVVYSDEDHDIESLSRKFKNLNEKHDLDMNIVEYGEFKTMCTGCLDDQPWKFIPQKCKCGGTEFIVYNL